ncbi:MAG: inorganic phosphate transporter [Chlorobi bacterium]|nr:inorganic phosphate transporter [Chlorobiota bacterium]
MENIYLAFVVILFILAVSDLVVGVSNDAVNFLNSAIGAKAAPYRIIMIVAAAGIFVGATFSTGMMEVARKGIFNPQFFYFSDIMIIFMAVMLTDIILLDVFNTIGLPTSTTVSIVFELLGAATAVAIIKASHNPDLPVSEYINSAKALAIISGILLSVVVSFIAGAVIQFITRLFFSFDYSHRMKYLGAVWGGIAISAITYFILVKGAKSASFMDDDTKRWIHENGNTILIYSFLGWTLLLSLLRTFFKLDILKLIVLVGTFALAMAFAGNDLVNFIGVPLAGFESFKLFINTPGATPDTFLMTGLAGKIKTETYLLVIAGTIMVITLWTSKKAKTVVQTSLDLSRQQEGDERFGSSFFARSLVRGAINTSHTVTKFMPARLRIWMNKQFDSTAYEEKREKLGKDAPAFDMIRASVNLVVASILISIATNYKLPLSTTYVTFMVAMGSSLTDRAWGRESAVYRITGVLSVIGGWFLTAFSAFTVAFIVANVIYFGGIAAVVVLLFAAGYFIYRSHTRFDKKKGQETEISELEIEEIDGELLSSTVLNKCKLSVSAIIKEVADVYNKSLDAFEREDRKQLKDITKEVEVINKKTKKLKNNIFSTVKKLQEEEIDSSLYYVQVVDYLRETAHCLTYITKPCFEHVDNNHKIFTKEQFKELKEIRAKLTSIINESVEMIEKSAFGELDGLLAKASELVDDLRKYRKEQLKRIKKEKAGTKGSLLYLNILHETQNLLLHLVNLLKAQRDFVDYKSDEKDIEN